jgi:hypothetical protein
MAFSFFGQTTRPGDDEIDSTMGEVGPDPGVRKSTL